MPVVNPNPNMWRVADIGGALRDKEAITYGRMRNEALGMDLEEAENMLANRKKAEEIRGMNANIEEEIADLEAAGLYAESDQRRDAFIRQSKAEAELIGEIRNGIENQEEYDQFRNKMITSGSILSDMMPEEYSDTWFRDQQDQRKGNLSRLTRKWMSEDGATMAQDIVQQDGEVRWEGEPYRAPSAGAGAPKQFSSGDQNTIRSGAALFFGGFYDPRTGQYSGLARDTAQSVIAISSEAARIYMAANQEGIQLSHDDALAQAARKLNINVQNLDQNENANPFNVSRPEGQ